jgi:hypothetical protein
MARETLKPRDIPPAPERVGRAVSIPAGQSPHVGTPAPGQNSPAPRPMPTNGTNPFDPPGRR